MMALCLIPAPQPRGPQWRIEGWAPAGPGFCRCPDCGKRVSTNARARASHKSLPHPSDIVAYELVPESAWFWGGGASFVVLTSDRIEAIQYVYELDGPYTTNTCDVRGITRAEREQRRRAAATERP